MSVSTVPSIAPEDVGRLSPEDREALRDMVIASRTTLIEQLAASADYNEGVDATAATSGQGETEHTSIDIERRVNRVLDGNAREALAEHDSALLRFDNGTYGTCHECRRAIPVERLFAIPTASLCVSCRERKDSTR
jgi:DnaK suppressor protein